MAVDTPTQPAVVSQPVLQNIIGLLLLAVGVTAFITWNISQHVAADRVMAEENAKLKVQNDQLTREVNDLRSRLSLPPHPGRPIGSPIGATSTGSAPEPSPVN